jgi:flagellar biogenesis protein FliO
MKFANKARLKEQVIDFVAKGILILFSGLVCLWMISGARAGNVDIVNIQGKQTDGSYDIEFSFSKTLQKDDVQVEFQRNFIQVSFRGVSAYPARTEKLTHPSTDKVFTYQYQPDLARARILLKTSAVKLQNAASWNVEGKSVKVSLKIDGALAQAVKDEIKSTASSVAPTGNAASRAPAVEDPEEKKIRDALLSGDTNIAEEKKSATASATAESTENLPIFVKNEEKAKQSVDEKGTPAAKVFASLLLVVGLIGAGALAFRKFVLGKHSPFQKQTRMIQVVSSQAMGPKRSIALVKVLDQHLVVGMSGDSMNLLVNLGNNVNLDSFTDEMGPGISFSETLTTAVKTDAFDREEARIQKASTNLGFRSTLKKRLEGLKPL